MRTLITRLIVILVLFLTGTSIGHSNNTTKTALGKALAETKGEQRDTISTKKPYYRVLFFTRFYAKKYNVPEIYLFRLLQIETGFRLGDTTYNPFSKFILGSKWDGPYQMLTSTARSAWPDTFKTLTNAQFRHKMRFDLEFNCHTAIRYISQLYKKYKAWDKVFSVYNQGPRGANRINRYARRVVNGL